MSQLPYAPETDPAFLPDFRERSLADATRALREAFPDRWERILKDLLGVHVSGEMSRDISRCHAVARGHRAVRPMYRRVQCLLKTLPGKVLCSYHMEHGGRSVFSLIGGWPSCASYRNPFRDLDERRVNQVNQRIIDGYRWR